MILFFADSQPGVSVKHRALVIEDDAPSRLSLVRILEMYGFEAIGVPSMAEGFRALENLPQSLILDLMLPDGNGIEILRRIRQQKLPIRVAILTGADKPMIAEAQALNPDAMFTKPVDLTRLMTWLKAA